MPVLQGPLRGKRWIAGSCSHGCWLGTYEFGKQRAFAAVIRQGDVVYDLGANVGWYTLMGSVLGASRVYSFEPVPANLSFLREHLALNGIENCTVYPAAVGRYSGMAHFAVGRTSSDGHLAGQTGPHDIAVRLVSLDELIESDALLPPDVIKCDIEGGEFDALLGARKTLERFSPTIFVATHSASLHKMCSEFLRDLRYETAPIEGSPFEDELIAVKPVQPL